VNVELLMEVKEIHFILCVLICALANEQAQREAVALMYFGLRAGCQQQPAKAHAKRQDFTGLTQ
jgi:hypothetical protein